MMAATGRLIQRHDQFAKLVLDEPGNADAFCRERLPPEVAAQLSKTPAIDRSASDVAPFLYETRGDRGWSLATGVGEPILVWTYVEHKGRRDPETSVQTLKLLAWMAAKGAVRRETEDARMVCTARRTTIAGVFGRLTAASLAAFSAKD